MRIKKILKIIGILSVLILLVLSGMYVFILQYPEIKDHPKMGKWYRVTTNEMKSSDGSKYSALFKKGSENNIIVYFAGGGVSVNKEMARQETYNTKRIPIDIVANLTMNMGGIATASEDNPFKDWTVIAFPYATGDFHIGTGEFKYTDNNGKERTLYHNGFINFTSAMRKIMEYADIADPAKVFVTGYSAGGFGASLLADDIFSDYFPKAKSKTVLADSSLLLNDSWHSIATDVWRSPKHISDRLVSNNITLDSLTALHERWGDKVNILFDSSTRDGDLAKVQNYFDTGNMKVDEEKADKYQQILKETIPKFKKQANAYIFIWDGLPWYDDPQNLTMHTIIATPAFHNKFKKIDISICDWVINAVNGKMEDYGLNLVDKIYPPTDK
ncbi:pectin acetylesterase-family hydrolase [Paenibacillus wenxiniae]|uniref:Pectin acetylesterase-family hydrolase n=1 Tax=Paenibacillus wenxiniae TaxID=1636843 RepID=A0ABW4RQ01_9BACL